MGPVAFSLLGQASEVRVALASLFYLRTLSFSLKDQCPLLLTEDQSWRSDLEEHYQDTLGEALSPEFSMLQSCSVGA